MGGGLVRTLSGAHVLQEHKRSVLHSEGPGEARGAQPSVSLLSVIELFCTFLSSGLTLDQHLQYISPTWLSFSPKAQGPIMVIMKFCSLLSIIKNINEQ